jgi:hypothetical protein
MDAPVSRSADTGGAVGSRQSVLFARHRPVSLGVIPCRADQFIGNAHERCQPQSMRLLSRRPHAPVRQRPHLCHRITRSRLHHSGRPGRSPSGRSRDCPVHRWPGPTVARSPAGRAHGRETGNANHPSPLWSQCVHGRVTVVISGQDVPTLLHDNLQWSHTLTCGRWWPLYT